MHIHIFGQAMSFNNYGSGARRLTWLKSALLLLLLQGYSCNSRTGGSRELVTHFSEATFSTAKSARNPKEARDAIHYIDSVYATFPYVSVADKCRYYLFMSQVNLDSLDCDDARSLRYIDSAINIIESNNLTDALEPDYTRAMQMKGGYMLEHNRFAEAYTYYAHGLSIARQHNNSCAEGSFEGVLGSLFFRQGRYALAIEHYRKSFSSALECTDSNTRFVQVTGNKSNLALSLLRMGQADSALIYFQATLEFVNAQPQLKARNEKYVDQALGVLYGNMAQAYMQLGDYTRAEMLYKKSIQLNDREGYEINDATVTMLHLAELYLIEGRNADADHLLRQTLPRIPVGSGMRLEWLKVRWHYELQQHHSNALQDELNYYRFKDSLSERQKPFLNSSFIQAFADEAKNQQIQLIRKDSDMRRLLLVIAVVISALLAVTAAVIFVSLNKTRRLMQQMTQLSQELVAQKEQKRKEDLFLQEMELQLANQNNLIAQRKKISDDMHDDLSSSLIALKFFIGDALKRTDSDISRKLLASIEDELSAVYDEARAYINNLRTQAHQQQYNLTQYLVDLARKFDAHTSLRITTAIDTERIEESLDIAQNEHLYHIIKEGLSNVIKHSAASSIRIAVSFEQAHCYFVIADNGKGLSNHQRGRGQGLESIRHRVLQLNGHVDISSDSGGTTISGSFPL